MNIISGGTLFQVKAVFKQLFEFFLKSRYWYTPTAMMRCGPTWGPPLADLYHLNASKERGRQ